MNVALHQTAPSIPAEDELGDPRLILRDGSAAVVRSANPADRAELRRFFSDLSPESRYRRFMGATNVADDLIDRFCSPDPSKGLTLLVLRPVRGKDHVVAAASYFAVTNTTAEVAFAVDDHFQGKGLATLLLARLAESARTAGFRTFEAETLADNQAMLGVFHHSGFATRSHTDHGCVELELSLAPSSDHLLVPS